MESEPVIVVDQENCINEEDEDLEDVAGTGQGCPDTPPQDPFFLSPFRDMRKRSLPTPQCTSGITASQVRRLSDQGAAGAAAREKAFLATLTRAPGPHTPGRRHSVITISKAPIPLFGRNRRESIAAFPSKGPRVNRRDSVGGATPSPTGSQFNLQLDIMDDIADFKARKVRMKMWQTEDKEKVCELQSLDGENKQMSRFKEARRYSNIDVCEKMAPPIPPRRRASELPPSLVAAGKSTAGGPSSGIVCTNTDLLSIMNSLKSTANKALQLQSTSRPGSSKTTDSLPVAAATGADRRRDVLRTGRSNSVDVANLGVTAAMAAAAAGNSTRNWFRKISARGSTAAAAAAAATVQSSTGRGGGECGGELQRAATIGSGCEYVVQKSPVVVTFADDERPKVSLLVEPASSKPDRQPPPPPPSPQPQPQPATDGRNCKTAAGPDTKGADVVVWDRPTGSVVNAEVLGTAIEGFLASKKTGDGTGDGSPAADGEQQPQQPGGKPAAAPPKTPANDPNNGRTCDTSICSSLKDLFVK